VNSKIGPVNRLPADQAARAIGRILSDIFDQFEGASEELMIEAMEPTFTKSQEYCPTASGVMRASGYLEKTGFRGKPRVEIGYGRGGYPHYTVYVHEMTGIFHEPPTRSKWLQAAVMEDTDAIYERLGRGYKAFMNG
jgi:hypothetical protein